MTQATTTMTWSFIPPIHVLLIWCLLMAHCLPPKCHAFSPKYPSVINAKKNQILLPASITTRISSQDIVSHFRHTSKADNQLQQRCSTQLNYIPSSDDDLVSEETKQDESSWTLAEDWELMDQVSKFTVGEGSQCRTFWTQMAACIPSLATKSSEDLLARCQYLEQQQNKQNNKDSTNAEGDSKASTSSPATSRRVSSRSTMQFGPSPPLLSQWTVDEDSNNNNNNAMVGQLQDGRTIWLHYHCIGRLPGDPLSDVSSPSVLQLVPGGYVEAVGGRIYELGEARATKIIPSPTSSTGTDHGSSMETKVATSKLSEWKKGDSSLDWLMPQVTASVSAFLACTVLSACIGYGAGLSIVADDHNHAATSTAAATQPSVKTHTTSSSTPSLAEQKARTEYRILREQRMLQRMTERLEQDKNYLMELQQKGI